MNLDEDIIFDKGANNVIGEGGTAYIMTAKLRSSLIAKHRCSSVAVKIMTESSESCSKDFTDSFLYEVALMNSLPKSPNIVHFIGYSTQPLMTLVMKLYSTSLKTLLARQELFENDAEILLKIAHDICNGMKQIHSYGILHLDLKPSKRHNITDGYGLTVDVDNVLVDIMGDMSFNCVICDFGFASFIGESDKLVSDDYQESSVE
jgi:serine/threonine protein kinase